MRDFVYGYDCLIEARKGDNNYYPFACAEEVEIRLISELLETTSADSGAWEYFEPSGKNKYSASIRGITVLRDLVDTLWFPLETFLIQVRTDGVYLKFTFTDSQGHSKIAYGFAYIPESTINGIADDFSRWNLQLQGSGPLDLSGAIVLPETHNNVKTLRWITTGAEPNTLQHNDLIGLALSDIVEISLEGDDKWHPIDSGEPGDKTVRHDTAAGSLRWKEDFMPNQYAFAIIKIP